jgi:hypothetical protein
MRISHMAPKQHKDYTLIYSPIKAILMVVLLLSRSRSARHKFSNGFIECFEELPCITARTNLFALAIAMCVHLMPFHYGLWVMPTVHKLARGRRKAEEAIQNSCFHVEERIERE